jgi:hypothetical protein
MLSTVRSYSVGEDQKSKYLLLEYILKKLTYVKLIYHFCYVR